MQLGEQHVVQLLGKHDLGCPALVGPPPELGIRPVVPALALGSTVLLKPDPVR